MTRIYLDKTSRADNKKDVTLPGCLTLLADAMLDNVALKDLLGKKW